MERSVSNAYRYLLQGLILGLGLNHLVLGLFWLQTFVSPGPVMLAFSLYLICLVPSIYGHEGVRLPRTQAYLNAFLLALIPYLALSQLPVANYLPSGSYQTWFVAGVSLVAAITSARGYPMLGWLSVTILWVEVIAWGGPNAITNTGLIGALILVATAWAMGRGLRSTEAEAKQYHAKAAEISTRTARNLASRNERQRLLQSTLLTGLPLLERIVDQAGDLSDADRQEASLLESRFRDEIQGRALLNDGVRVATREARKRGVTVTFNDDGGIDGLAQVEVDAIHASIVQAINGTNAGKIYISAPQGENFAVSIIASRPEANAPDLWLRLP
jgi:hypothetical protein